MEEDRVRFLRRTEIIKGPFFSKSVIYIYAALIPKSQVVCSSYLIEENIMGNWFDLVDCIEIIPDTKDHKLVIFNTLGDMLEVVQFLFPRYINKPIALFNSEDPILSDNYINGRITLLVPKEIKTISPEDYTIINLRDKKSCKEIMGINFEDYTVFEFPSKTSEYNKNKILEEIREIKIC